MEILIVAYTVSIIVLSVIVARITQTVKRQAELIASLTRAAVKSADLFKLIAQAIEEKKGK